MDGLVDGRIVYFVDGSGYRHPSIVTLTFPDNKINVTVFYDGGHIGGASHVPYDPDGKEFSWYWMYPGQNLRGGAK